MVRDKRKVAFYSQAKPWYNFVCLAVKVCYSMEEWMKQTKHRREAKETKNYSFFLGEEKMAKKIAVLVLVLGMVVSAQATNLLWNGSFDANSSAADGWWTYLPEPDNQAITIQAGTLSTLCAHVSNATTASVQLGQSVAGAAGDVVVVSGAFQSTFWGGSGITINYVDSSWAYLGYAYVQLYKSTTGEDTGWQTFRFTTGSGEGTWTAPAGTAHITLKIEQWDWSEFSYDEMSLSVPEPATMLVLAIGGLLIRKRA
jgi:hypothetical protein